MKSSLSPDPAFLRLAHVSVFKLIVLALHFTFCFWFSLMTLVSFNFVVSGFLLCNWVG